MTAWIWGPGQAAPSKDDSGFDTDHIHELYLEGDFGKAMDLLERAEAEGKLRNRQDSIFALKHMGVMYVADKATQPKGESYLERLIRLDPSASILDMFVSDKILVIFRNVWEKEGKRRLLSAPSLPPPAAPGENHGRASPAPPGNLRDTLAGPAGAGAANAKAPETHPKPRSKPELRWLFVGGAGAAVVAGIVGVVALNRSDAKSPAPRLENHDVE